MRYGRRLKGTERLTPKEFNRKVHGEGLGIKIDGLKEMLRIPANAEAQHVQIIADTGGGKTTIIMQMLRQIRSRGDSAIVYDPALEYTRRFYDPKHDIILNPLDRRCPTGDQPRSCAPVQKRTRSRCRCSSLRRTKKASSFSRFRSRSSLICCAMDRPRRSLSNG